MYTQCAPSGDSRRPCPHSPTAEFIRQSSSPDALSRASSVQVRRSMSAFELSAAAQITPCGQSASSLTTSDSNLPVKTTVPSELRNGVLVTSSSRASTVQFVGTCASFLGRYIVTAVSSGLDSEKGRAGYKPAPTSSMSTVSKTSTPSSCRTVRSAVSDLICCGGWSFGSGGSDAWIVGSRARRAHCLLLRLGRGIASSDRLELRVRRAVSRNSAVTSVQPAASFWCPALASSLLRLCYVG